VALLQAGIPIELNGDRRLVLGALREGSPYAHTTVAASGRKLDGDCSNILAIIRGNSMLTPHPDTTLEPGDKLILVVAQTGEGHTSRHLAIG
jgi:Trk K+ transport system NAD-binding subunit